jgi:hypothetical protein
VLIQCTAVLRCCPSWCPLSKSHLECNFSELLKSVFTRPCSCADPCSYDPEISIH